MPYGRHSVQGRVLTVAAVMAAVFMVTVVGAISRGVGGEGERRVIAESRFAVTNAPL
jgi:hypothetical protein